MRHPVSTLCRCEQRGGGAVLRGLAGLAVLPGAAAHAWPSAREDADGVSVIATARAGLRMNVGGLPGRPKGESWSARGGAEMLLPKCEARGSAQ